MQNFDCVQIEIRGYQPFHPVSSLFPTEFGFNFTERWRGFFLSHCSRPLLFFFCFKGRFLQSLTPSFILCLAVLQLEDFTFFHNYEAVNNTSAAREWRKFQTRNNSFSVSARNASAPPPPPSIFANNERWRKHFRELLRGPMPACLCRLFVHRRRQAMSPHRSLCVGAIRKTKYPKVGA